MGGLAFLDATGSESWQDRHGITGVELSEVRLLKEVTGFASVSASREDEEVLVPPGTTGTVLYVNYDKRLIGVEFADGIEGNVFGNVRWDDVEIVPLHPIGD